MHQKKQPGLKSPPKFKIFILPFQLLELQLSATSKKLAGTGRVFQYECGDECEEVAKLRSAGHFSRWAHYH